MSRTIETNINPQLLIWARQEQGYDIQSVIKKLNFSDLEYWESGEKKPSIPQILKLANLYKRPSAVFFLSKPPQVKKIHVDFRSAALSPELKLSPETRSEIRVCESRRKKALEMSESLKISVDFSLSTLKPDTDIEKAALSIRNKLGVLQDEISNCRTDKESLDYWIQTIEQANILIFRSITLNGWNPSFKEIRGTSSYYPEYPWILINSQEHERGQLFTLGHELAHILAHKSGICTLDEIHTESSLSSIERFCNQFSAALFVPKSVFEEFAHKKNLRFSNKKQIDNAVDKMQKYFHISIEASARRLFSLGYASKEYYLKVRKQQIEALVRERQKKSPGGDGTKYYKRVIQWNGMKYTHLVLDSLHENSISLADAAHSLRTDVKHLESIEKELYK